MVYNKNNKKISGVYCIENLINGKKYVGQTTNLCQRGSFHFILLENNEHSCTELQEDYNQSGIKNFIYRVLEVCSIENLFLKENEYIKRFNAVENGYNSTYGGETGFFPIDSFSDEVQEAISTVKQDDYRIRLSKEKNLFDQLLSSYVGTKVYSKSKEQDEFKEKFFDCLLIPKKTNYRRKGIRSINSIIQEDNLPYIIKSKREEKKKNRGRTYWYFLHKK